MEVLAVAIVVSVIAPLITGWVTNRLRRAEKQEDWARLDKVAADAKKDRDQASKEREEVRLRAEEAADLLAESNTKAEERAANTDTKLEVIRVDVNSNMTAAKKLALDSMVRELAALKEIVRLNRAAGNEPDEAAIAVIAATEDAIGALGAELRDRLAHAETTETEGEA